MTGLWILIGLLIAGVLFRAALWMPLLARRRNRVPGRTTLYDEHQMNRAHAEMTLRQGHPNRNKTSKF